MRKLEPLIEQRADPYIHRHGDGWYYFTASVPAYDGIELRRARTIAGLAGAKTAMVWRKPDSGPCSDLVWAPELHFNMGAWYVYFAAAPSREIKDDLFQHRMYAISTRAENPLQGDWTFEGQIDSGMDSFCLDATTFTHKRVLYYLWAQKEAGIRGNSNLYIAPLETPVKLAGKPVGAEQQMIDLLRRYFGHPGAYFAECVFPWGAVFMQSYGWDVPAAERSDLLLDVQARQEARGLPEDPEDAVGGKRPLVGTL